MESLKKIFGKISFAPVNKVLDKIPYDKIVPFPAYQRGIAIALMIMLLPTAYYFTICGGQNNSIKELEGDISSLELDVARLKRISKSLPKLEKEVDEMTRKLKRVRARLPDEKEISSLLTEISYVGTHGGLDFITFKPMPEVCEEYYARVPVSMNIEGTYHNLLSFFDQISRMPRIVTISEIELSGGREKDGQMLIKAKCLATTFRYMTAEERERRKEMAEKKG